MWQTLESKARFIAQVMNGDATVRRAEDVDAAALTYAEVKAIASGNPLVIEKASVDAEVIRLSRLKKQHLDSQYQLRYRIKSFAESADICRREIANMQEDWNGNNMAFRSAVFCMPSSTNFFSANGNASPPIAPRWI